MNLRCQWTQNMTWELDKPERINKLFNWDIYQKTKTKICCLGLWIWNNIQILFVLSKTSCLFVLSLIKMFAHIYGYVSYYQTPKPYSVFISFLLIAQQQLPYLTIGFLFFFPHYKTINDWHNIKSKLFMRIVKNDKWLYYDFLPTKD